MRLRWSFSWSVWHTVTDDSNLDEPLRLLLFSLVMTVTALPLLLPPPSLPVVMRICRSAACCPQRAPVPSEATRALLFVMSAPAGNKRQTRDEHARRRVTGKSSPAAVDAKWTAASEEAVVDLIQDSTLEAAPAARRGHAPAAPAAEPSEAAAVAGLQRTSGAQFRLSVSYVVLVPLSACSYCLAYSSSCPDSAQLPFRARRSAASFACPGVTELVVLASSHGGLELSRLPASH